MNLHDKKVAVVGFGTMGQALVGALLKDEAVKAANIVATVAHKESAERLVESTGVRVGTDNEEAVRGAELVLLCAKPKVTRRILAELKAAGALAHGPLLVSIAAGVSTGELEELAGEELAVVRAMPNTPCLVGEGMIVLSAGTHAGDSDLDAAEALLGPLGRVLRLDEEHMDAVTGLSASGPAFIYVMSNEDRLLARATGGEGEDLEVQGRPSPPQQVEGGDTSLGEAALPRLLRRRSGRRPGVRRGGGRAPRRGGGDKLQAIS